MPHIPLGASPRHNKANITGYLVKFHANEDDQPCVEGQGTWSIIGRVIKDEFEARAFWAAHQDMWAVAEWCGPGAWRYDPIKEKWTDANGT